MTGVSWLPPPHRLAGPVLRLPVAGGGGRWGGGVPAERLGGGGRADGGGGARSRSRIAGSGGRAGLRPGPAATGRVADGAGPMKTTGHVKTESTEAVVYLWA